MRWAGHVARMGENEELTSERLRDYISELWANSAIHMHQNDLIWISIVIRMTHFHDGPFTKQVTFMKLTFTIL
jgi:hypothetical protein